jgi:hypothetical protein
VTTVIEEREDDNSDVANKLKALRLSAPETVEEESGAVEVPVIVENVTEAEPEAPRPVVHREDSHPQGVVIDVQESFSPDDDDDDDDDAPLESEALPKVETLGGDNFPTFEHEKVEEPKEQVIEREEVEEAEPPVKEEKVSDDLETTNITDFATDQPAEKTEPITDPAEAKKESADDGANKPALGEAEGAS